MTFWSAAPSHTHRPLYDVVARRPPFAGAFQEPLMSPASRRSNARVHAIRLNAAAIFEIAIAATVSLFVAWIFQRA